MFTKAKISMVFFFITMSGFSQYLITDFLFEKHNGFPMFGLFLLRYYGRLVCWGTRRTFSFCFFILFILYLYHTGRVGSLTKGYRPTSDFSFDVFFSKIFQNNGNDFSPLLLLSD